MARTRSTSWQLRARAELERRRRATSNARQPPAAWYSWLRAMFPAYVTAPFAPRHEELWGWVWSITPEARPLPLVAVWPRGGAKSTSAELAAVALGARSVRKYCWYVRETQDQADGSVTNVNDMLESSSVAEYYPLLGEREIGKYGQVRGWRRNRLWTAAGYVVDAVGLDTAVRGAKVKEARPDFIILDDIDGKHDTPRTTEKKIQTLTTSLLPAGSQNVAVLAIQNLIIPNGIFSRLANVAQTPAEFLADRIVSGPFPAVHNMEIEQRDGRFFIVAGEASWEGQDLDACQRFIDLWGYSAFLREAQHEVDDPPGGIWDHIEFRHCDWTEIPDLVRGCVWVDPAVTATDESDSMGIQADGIAEDGTIYRLYSWEAITSPEDALARAILKCLELGLTTVGIETDQGGDVWRPAYQRVCDELVRTGRIATSRRLPELRDAKAGSGYGSKVARNQQMLVDYEHGRVVHVRGSHLALEKGLKRFPKTKPFDVVDAAFWSWNFLRGSGDGTSAVLPPLDPLAGLEF